MDNWNLTFEDGSTLNELEAQYWDNVPTDKKIKQADFILLNGSKLAFDKFDLICIAKLGIAMTSGENAHTGYRITEIKGDYYTDFVIKTQGIARSVGKVSELTISKNCFRQGV